MRPVTAAFLRTVRGSHSMTARAFVVSTFQTGTQPDGVEIPILNGDVVMDGNANVRSTLDLTTDGTGMWPTRVGDLLAPYGNEIFVQRGIKYGNGTTEWCSLGYFRIQTPQQSNPPDGPIRIEARDRMASIVDARLLAPVQYLPDATYGEVVTDLITQVYPAATIQWDDATDAQTIDRSVISDADRFAFLNDMVTSLGKIWYWDYRGVLVITDPPDPTTPVYAVNAGAGGVLVSMSRHLTRDKVYNAVVASGEAADTNDPVRAVAYDANPASPTYFYGPFGPVPQFYSSPFVTTVAQAQAAADSLLRTQLGLPYQVDFTAVPNPALEPFDCVSVTSSMRAATEAHVLQSVTVPLSATATLSATTREQTTVLIGEL